MKGILKEKILDAKIEFTLREVLSIAKKDFNELVIDVIKGQLISLGLIEKLQTNKN